jgi:hypothetical protein
MLQDSLRPRRAAKAENSVAVTTYRNARDGHSRARALRLMRGRQLRARRMAAQLTAGVDEARRRPIPIRRRSAA